MLSNRLLILAVTLVIGSCDRDSEQLADLPDSSLPGVYSGTFPCQNCPGIRTTLWLRSDGRFFIRQRYPEDLESDEVTTYSIGRWSWIAGDQALELQGAGPRRRFVRRGRGALLMQTASDLEHRLSRDSTAPDFTATIAMAGMISMSDDGATFTECLTGLVAPVEEGGDFVRFQRQYRSVDAHGEPAFVEFEGRFTWFKDGSLKSFAIERFATVKANRIC